MGKSLHCPGIHGTILLQARSVICLSGQRHLPIHIAILLQAMNGKTESEPWDRLRNEHGGLTVQSRDCFRFSLVLHSLIAGRDQQLMTQIDDSSSSVIGRPQSRRTRGINDRSRGAEGRHNELTCLHLHPLLTAALCERKSWRACVSACAHA